MKLIIALLMSWNIHASDDAKLKELELKILKLEKQLATQGKASGLKVKDLGNKKIKKSASFEASEMIDGRSLSSESQKPKITPEQQKELMKQIEMIQKRQKESQKVLDEIMNDDY